MLASDGAGGGCLPACRAPRRQGGLARNASGAVRPGARAGRSLACRCAAGHAAGAGFRRASTPMNPIARGCGSRSGGCARMLRTLAGVSATPRGFALAPRRGARGRGAGAADRGAICGGAGLSGRWRVLVELGAGAGARRQPAHRTAGARRAGGGRQGAASAAARARRWMTPPLPGFTTTLLLPAPLPNATRHERGMKTVSRRDHSGVWTLSRRRRVDGVTYDGQQVWVAPATS